MKSIAYSVIAAPIGALLILGAAGPALAGGHDCDAVVSPPGTIQAAIDAASPGDKICIDNGTYAEDLNITTDGLTLEGHGKHTVVMGVQTVASAGFPDAGSPAVPKGNLNIDANGVTVKKLTLMLATGGATAYSAGITVNGTNVTLEKNHIVAPGGTPGTVAFQTWAKPNKPGGDLSGLRIVKNEFSGTAGDGFGYEAIFINPQDAVVDAANPVRIEKNKFSGDMYRAISADRGAVVVEKNKMRTDLTGAPIFGFLPQGIKMFSQASGVALEKNKVTDEGAGVFNVGLSLGAGSSGTAEKNDVRGAATTGVDVDADGWTLGKNKARDGAGDGFDVSGSGNTLTKNHSKDNGGFGIVETGAGNTYTTNKCKGNGAGASSPAGLC